MSDDSCCRGASDAPPQPLDENDVETEIDGIVDDDGQGDELWLAVDADHRGEAPHEDEGGIAKQQHLHVVAGHGEYLVVAAEHTGGLVGEENSAEEGEQQADAHTRGQGEGEELPGFDGVSLTEGIAYEHTGTGIDEQVEGEDELVDGLRQVDGAHAVGIDKVAHDDAVDDIAEAA